MVAKFAIPGKATMMGTVWCAQVADKLRLQPLDDSLSPLRHLFAEGFASIAEWLMGADSWRRSQELSQEKLEELARQHMKIPKSLEAGLVNDFPRSS